MSSKSKRPALNELDNLMDGIEAFIGNSGAPDDARIEASGEGDFGKTLLYSESNIENLEPDTAKEESFNERRANGNLEAENLSIAGSETEIGHQDTDKNLVTELIDISAVESNKTPFSEANKIEVTVPKGEHKNTAATGHQVELGQDPLTKKEDKNEASALNIIADLRAEETDDYDSAQVEPLSTKKAVDVQKDATKNSNLASPQQENGSPIDEVTTPHVSKTATLQQEISSPFAEESVVNVSDSASTQHNETSPPIDQKTAVNVLDSAPTQHRTNSPITEKIASNVSNPPSPQRKTNSSTVEKDALQTLSTQSEAEKDVSENTKAIPVEVSSSQKIELPAGVPSQSLASPKPENEEVASQVSPQGSGLVTLKNLAENATLPEKETSSRAQKQGLFTLEELSKPKHPAEVPVDEDDDSIKQNDLSIEAQALPLSQSQENSQEPLQETMQETPPFIKGDEKEPEDVRKAPGSLFSLSDLHPGTREISLIDPGYKNSLSSPGDGSIVTLKDLAGTRSDQPAEEPAEDALQGSPPNEDDNLDEASAAAKATVARVTAEIEDLLREMQEDEPSKAPQVSSFIPAAQESAATKEIRELLKDEPVYVYTSLAGGGYLMPSRTNRLAQILTANQVTFTYRDLGTDDEARQVWKRHGRGRSLPAVVRGRDDIVGNWEEMDDANEEYRVRELIYETL
ncbi:Aip5p LALA0_S03e08680g [Lachancea lanzarotensis]|uniref:LALA0S03e08680g1_1 n=1 Tax=Lachancea lanzarotensis TaxID=1245769 RepID=A0A0C7MP81_9SACH|nr:uncharacterized protein LALA0_S03e08680g [Lachancea lanzarotensis]CEP61692.1 LALA0S03e08680g1_1 [Lachancea lanzarotensis]